MGSHQSSGKGGVVDSPQQQLQLLGPQTNQIVKVEEMTLNDGCRLLIGVCRCHQRSSKSPRASESPQDGTGCTNTPDLGSLMFGQFGQNGSLFGGQPPGYAAWR